MCHPLAFGKGNQAPPSQFVMEGDGPRVPSLVNPAFIHGQRGALDLADLKDFISDVKSNIRDEIYSVLALEEAGAIARPPLRFAEKRRFLPIQLVG